MRRCHTEASRLSHAGPKDHWTRRRGARLTGCYEQLRVRKITDKSAAARSIHAVTVSDGLVLLSADEAVGGRWQARVIIQPSPPL